METVSEHSKRRKLILETRNNGSDGDKKEGVSC